ncbi:ATP-binding protein [Denitrificimonas sp. JX-1]|uniref:ATP-binding protein n=1 Tax=Denitrificimonas halotolerans TaxID=3098930 RepID=A0ABU5GSQ5_9GAMM|nr:ATP-binding protein [Denitrificimonas sp. JX-1]MDY7219642.1 ATP-binding protein [Denitrificimonas sp. JX-1]
MSHLLRIIMINGHLGGVVELDLTGHTNICGSNASGKTTLQRLIPVFYGERPNNVVPKTRKKFDQYYLPHSDSYLIYEYRREAGQLCHVVITRKKDEGVSYRFVNSAYQPELYLRHNATGQLETLSYAELTSHLRQHKIEHSSLIDTISDYRSVIQNDFRLLASSSRAESTRLRQIALRYSLAENPHRLRHIEKLVSAVHAKEGKMDTLKTMLAAIFEDEGVALPSTKIKSTQVREWVQQVRQSRRLSTLQADMAGLSQQVDQLNATEQALWQLQPLLLNDASQLERKCADQEADIKVAQRAQKEKEVQYQAARDELNDKLSKVGSELKQVEADLDSIEQRNSDFEQRDMASLEQAVNQLPSWRAQRDELDTHLHMLRDMEGNSRQRFESRKYELSEQLNEFVEQVSQKQQKVRDEEQAVRQQQEQQKNQLEQSHQQQRQALQAEFQTQQNLLYQQQAEVKARLSVSFLTPEEQQELDAEQARIEEIQLQLANQNDQVERLRDECEQSKRQRDAHLDEIKIQRQSLRQAEQQYLQLKLQQAPKEGSLRQFLQQQMPGWQHSVGKLIREDLLERTDLAPRINSTEADPAQQLFNMCLDLAAIELPDYAQDEQALLDAIAKALDQLHDVEDNLQALEDVQKTYNAQCDQQQDALHKAQQARDRYRADLGFAQDSRQRLLERQQQLQHARKKSLQEQQAQLAQQLDAVQAQQQSALKERDSAFRNMLLEYQADWQHAVQILHEKIEQFSASITAKRREVEQQVHELQVALEHELREQGIDPEQLKEIEQRLKTMRQQVSQTEARRDELEDYRHFIRVDWQIRKPQLLAQEHELKQQQLSLSDALKALEHGFLEHKKTALRALQAQEEQLQGQRALLEQVVPLLKQLEQFPAPTEALAAQTQQPTGNTAERIERTRQALQDKHQLDSRLKNSLHLFERELLKDASVHFADIWSTQQRDLGVNPSAQALLKAYQDMLHILQNQQQNLLSTGRNFGKDLQDFFTVFSDLNSRISAQSRRLSEEVSDEFVLEGITRSEVKIQSTIDELGFWKPLKRFAKLYAQWQQDFERLPNDAYLEALSDVADLLRSDQEFTFESLLRLELLLNEGGTDLVIRNDRQLLESSSHGMAYLILCKYLLAFTRLLRGQAQVSIHWPIDEIGTLAYHNVEKLFKACENNQIYIVGAFPNPESDVLTLFQHRYLIEREAGQSKLKRIEPKLSRLAQRLQQRREEAAQ